MPETILSLSITWTRIMHLCTQNNIQTLKRSLESKFHSWATSFTNTLFKEHPLVDGTQQTAGIASDLAKGKHSWKGPTNERSYAS